MPLELLCEVCDDGWLSDGGNAAKEKSSRAQPKSVKRLRTHTPKNPYCQACLRAKLYRAIARRKHKVPGDGPHKFGELVSADHLIAQSEESMGLPGERDALIVVDRYSK